jgi:hypothetical protein
MKHADGQACLLTVHSFCPLCAKKAYIYIYIYIYIHTHTHTHTHIYININGINGELSVVHIEVFWVMNAVY